MCYKCYKIYIFLMITFHYEEKNVKNKNILFSCIILKLWSIYTYIMVVFIVVSLLFADCNKLWMRRTILCITVVGGGMCLNRMKIMSQKCLKMYDVNAKYNLIFLSVNFGVIIMSLTLYYKL